MHLLVQMHLLNEIKQTLKKDICRENIICSVVLYRENNNIAATHHVFLVFFVKIGSWDTSVFSLENISREVFFSLTEKQTSLMMILKQSILWLDGWFCVEFYEKWIKQNICLFVKESLLHQTRRISKSSNRAQKKKIATSDTKSHDLTRMFSGMIYVFIIYIFRSNWSGSSTQCLSIE